MAREFAPGIPAGRVIKSVPRVSPKADNQEWDVSLSMHPAAVRGDHFDLRLVDPKGRAHSWAMSKMPEPGQSTYAAQQATHTKGYALRKKPWSIPPGYGATRPGALVEPVYVQKAEVIQAGNDKIRFLRHHGQETDEFVLRKVREEGGKPLWALHNATKNRYTREGQQLPSSKPQYKEIRPEQVNFSDVGEVMTPKLDGAHVLVDMKGPGAPMRVYSYRPTERQTGVIEHTFKFPDFQKHTTTPATKNTLIRAELWGSKDGKAIPSEELGGLLNAGVLRSRKMQEEKGVQLRLTGIDVVKHKGRNYANKTFDQKLNALREITRGSKGVVELPPVARTEEEKRKLLVDIERGRLPETKEGVILHRIDGVAPPTKVKFKPQHDVYVREVFDKPRGAARGHAGGFAYSMEPDGPIVGRVGTGFSHSTRKDMLENPDKYVGRVAKVKSQGPFRSGALRAPSFDEWHIDKTPPELMKEGAAGHIMITGVPGAGKTTEAKRLAEETGMPMVSIDGLPAEYRGPGHWVRTDGARRFLKDLDEPHIVEGTQLMGLTPEERKGHDFRLMQQPRDVIVQRLVDRGWRDDTGKMRKGEAARPAAGKLYDEQMSYPSVAELHGVAKDQKAIMSLRKESQDATLKAIKEYKDQAVERLMPTVLQEFLG